MTSASIRRPFRFGELKGLRPSLLLRIAATLVVMLLCLGAVLFFAADRLITREFEIAQKERTLRQADELRRLLADDLRQIRGQSLLAATDSDLKHSTQYHVRLRGEAKAAQQDVDRIARTLDFPFVALLSYDGRTIAEHAGATFSPPPGGGGSRSEDAAAFAVWHHGRLWLVSDSTVQNEGMNLARLRVARPAAAPLSARSADATIRAVPAAAPAEPDGASVHVLASAIGETGEPLRLDLVNGDQSTAIVQRAKNALLWVFILGCAIAAAVMVAFLRREILPLAELTRAVAAVGRGDFRPRVAARGAGEIAELTSAFNSMAEDLGRLRGMERELREQEKITAIGRLATRLAHDINNPLTVIKNAALLLQLRGDNDEQTRSDLALIIHHCGRCATILENLLLFGRPLRLRVQEVDLDEFCKGVVARAQLRHPGGRWGVAAPPRRLAIKGDAQQLEQMLENLLNNAYEAASAAPIELSWGLREGRPFLQVRDRGSGFSTEAKGHLFELFYTTKKGGTGVGLANASAIARAHGGDLVVENDAGAVVRVELPPTVIVAAG
ncbi:MAG: HAMP domain-containing histidine kinase [Burkholderiaceae bacterium]|nr:HAMP domain-containing histidine kinase [Burkholderiaceae bacterium]